MAALGMLLKKLIKEIEGMIDRGDCDGITEDQLEEISILVHQPECVGREDAANEGLTDVYEKYMERVDETTAPYVIYGTVAKVEVQCAIVG